MWISRIRKPRGPDGGTGIRTGARAGRGSGSGSCRCSRPRRTRRPPAGAPSCSAAPRSWYWGPPARRSCWNGWPSARPGRPCTPRITGSTWVQAVQHPGRLYIPYNGYEQLLPRIIAQLELLLPLARASWAYAGAAAIIAAACGLFVYHASAGHVRSAALRVLLGAAVVLLPVAPLEIADNVANSLWYLLIALFWALLWRPRTRGAHAAAAIVAFCAASSIVMAVLFAPLVAVRMLVLRRREQAAPAGWLAGCVLQVPAVLSNVASAHSRLRPANASLHSALAFYAHDVVLPALGWHLSWGLRDLAGENGATVIVAVVLAAVFGAALITQPRNRPFLVTALLTGLVLAVFADRMSPQPTAILPYSEWGARYTAVPIFLIECAAVAVADYLWRRRPTMGRRPGPGAVLATALVVAVLAGSWATDFRYGGWRSAAREWRPVAARWQRDCARSGTGTIRERVPHQGILTLRCGIIRF